MPHGGTTLARVLVVDDEEDMRTVLQILLPREGFDVVGLAEDGATALELARRHQPHVVVLDWMLPGGTGADVLPCLREAAPSARVVVYSAAMVEETARGLGADGFVSKAASPRMLAWELRRLLGS